MKRLTLETIVLSPEDAEAAERAGADRFEVCSALELGGLTPSMGTIRRIRSVCRNRIMCMIRPRQGGMDYTSSEVSVMEIDVEEAIRMGADGIVLAFLTARGDIHGKRCQEMLKRARRASSEKKLETVFHRGFDLTRNPEDALERIIDLGFDRILTSGAAPGASEGASRIRKLIEQAEGRIQILPGGGVDESNAAEILRATGADQLHVYLPGTARDRSSLSNPRIFFGRQVDELEYPVVDSRRVAKLRHILDGFHAKSVQTSTDG